MQATGDVIEDREVVAREVTDFLEAKGVKAAPMINLLLAARGKPTEAQIAVASRDHVVVLIRR